MGPLYSQFYSKSYPKTNKKWYNAGMTGEIPDSQDSKRELPLSSPTKLAEGKTKIVWETDNPEIVRIESKDDITAGDGEKRDILEGKAMIATETTVNVFRLLESKGIPTHFINQDSETSFLAMRADMIPLECVARRIATGSFLKRNPDVTEGHRFEDIPIEFYFKNDENHDPMIEYNNDGNVSLYNAKDPVKSRQTIGNTTLEELGITLEEIAMMKHLTGLVFEILESAWAEQDISLVDLKIKFGRDSEGNLMVADVIDNDSWRIWPGGNKEKMLDKQRYRNIEIPNHEQIKRIKEDYQQVAKMTRIFVD